MGWRTHFKRGLDEDHPWSSPFGQPEGCPNLFQTNSSIPITRSIFSRRIGHPVASAEASREKCDFRSPLATFGGGHIHVSVGEAWRRHPDISAIALRFRAASPNTLCSRVA